MSMEEAMKAKIDEIIKQAKEAYEKGGSEFSERDEIMFRSGIMNGVMIAGLTLVHAPVDKLVLGEK